MKKHNRITIIQLVITIILAAAGVITAISNREIYHTIAVQPEVRVLCFILWLTLVCSFIFILINLRMNKLNKKEYL